MGAACVLALVDVFTDSTVDRTKSAVATSASLPVQHLRPDTVLSHVRADKGGVVPEDWRLRPLAWSETNGRIASCCAGELLESHSNCSGERRALFVVYRAAHYAPGEDSGLALGCAVHKPSVRKGAAVQMQSHDAWSESEPSWRARQEQ